MRRFFIIVNPVSGKGNARKKLAWVKERFIRESIGFEVFMTLPAVKADQLIHEYFNSRFTDIMIIGGDGTLQEALNGNPPKDIPFSIITAGTGNDTARNLLATMKFRKQLDIAINGSIKKFDAGKCNNKIFLNGLGIGFDGRVVEEMEKSDRSRNRRFSYYKTVLKLITGYRESMLSINIDGETVKTKTFLLTVAKGRTFGGGFRLNPYAKSDDGLLDLCLITKVRIVKRIMFLPSMGSGGHRNLKEVRFFKCRKCIIEGNNDMVAHLDGEFIGSPPFQLEVLPGYVSVRKF